MDRVYQKEVIFAWKALKMGGEGFFGNPSILDSAEMRIRSWERDNQCRIENEFFTRRERYLNDRMGEMLTFWGPGIVKV